MASGDMIVFRQAAPPDARNTSLSQQAFIQRRNNHTVLAFKSSLDSEVYYYGVMPSSYGGGGVKVDLYWMAETAVTGTVRWQVAFERLNSGGHDLDTDSFAAAKSAGTSAPATSGVLAVTSISFSNAEIDSIANHEPFRLAVRRDADGTSGTDNMVNAAQLLAVYLSEV